MVAEIRLAQLEDVDEIMRFIHMNWKENHVLARNKDFFLYEHQDKNAINYVLSLEDNKINAVLGFIKHSDSKSDIATVIWKALQSNANSMLGIKRFSFLREHVNYNVLFSSGINAKTIGIYNYLEIYTNHLKQYVIINKDIQNFDILKVEDIESIKPIKFIEDSQYDLIALQEGKFKFDFNNQKYIPHKDEKYFVKRYFNHPIYNYIIYGVYKRGSLTSLIVTREVIVNNSKILRIVDYLGDEKDIPHITKKIYGIVVNGVYEYIDFICYGFDNKNLEKSGFTQINLDTTEIIAPNYFSPFVQKNIKINFMADTKEIGRLRICKADGDQDRPS